MLSRLTIAARRVAIRIPAQQPRLVALNTRSFGIWPFGKKEEAKKEEAEKDELKDPNMAAINQAMDSVKNKDTQGIMNVIQSMDVEKFPAELRGLVTRMKAGEQIHPDELYRALGLTAEEGEQLKDLTMKMSSGELGKMGFLMKAMPLMQKMQSKLQ